MDFLRKNENCWVFFFAMTKHGVRKGPVVTRARRSHKKKRKKQTFKGLAQSLYGTKGAKQNPFGVRLGTRVDRECTRLCRHVTRTGGVAAKWRRKYLRTCHPYTRKVWYALLSRNLEPVNAQVPVAGFGKKTLIDILVRKANKTLYVLELKVCATAGSKDYVPALRRKHKQQAEYGMKMYNTNARRNKTAVASGWYVVCVNKKGVFVY